MLKTVTAFSVVFALLITIALPSSVSAKSAAEKQARFTEKVKAGILKLGTGPQARVEVRLRDKTKLSGFISEANETSFMITDVNGAKAVVAYPDVAQVKGNNLSTGKKFAIAAVIVGALAIIYFAFFAGKHL
jgi:hypothetical protein